PLNNITYRGMNGGAYAGLLSGRVQAAFDNLPGSIGFIRNGQFRALGVTTTVRSDTLPDAPSISDFLPSYEISALYQVAERYATGSHRHAEQSGQRRTRRSRNEEEIRGSRRHDARRIAFGFRQVPRRRNRQMGQGDPRRRSGPDGVVGRISADFLL